MKWITILFLAAMSASAELKWEATEVWLQVHAVQVHADATFSFVNEGKAPVTVTSVAVSCGCLVPTLDKKTFASGEAGEITIRFNLRGRTGPQNKATIVRTDDGKTTSLKVSVDIPKAYSIAPIMMTWGPDQSAETKTAALINAAKEPINLIAATSSNPEVEIELKTIRAGFEYEVVVKRPAPGKNLRSVIRIMPELPPGFDEAKTLKLYVHAL